MSLQIVTHCGESGGEAWVRIEATAGRKATLVIMQWFPDATTAVAADPAARRAIHAAYDANPTAWPFGGPGGVEEDDFHCDCGACALRRSGKVVTP